MKHQTQTSMDEMIKRDHQGEKRTEAFVGLEYLTLDQVLSDAEVFMDGDWVESKDQDQNGNVRLTQLADIGDGYWIDKSNRFMTTEKARDLRCTYLQQGDILVARMPDPIGRCCEYPGSSMPAVTVVDVCVIRPNQSRVFSRYLMHAINAPQIRQQILKHVTGTTRQRISRGNLKKLQIPLPPLAEQKRIAAILDAADALRTKRRESLAQLDALLQSTFLTLFGDPVANPMGWPMVTIGDLLSSTAYGTSKKAHEEESGFPCLRMNNITYAGGWDFSSLKYVDLEPKEVPKNTVQKGQILFNRTNSKELVGKTAVYRCDEPMAFAGYLVRGITNAEADAEYIAAFLNLPQGKAILQGMCKSIVGMANINAQEFKSIPIPKPPLPLQQKFAAIVESAERQKAAQRAHLAELDALFAALQHRAFRGEL